ncbi:hypothetical protein [Aminobacter sp. AP02]|uniref:hypothetical protein n=1 Tax=Aminobacter sp. AP02 TaxID=2135737 RepID=UPI000D6CE81C|nr:hypothetical protein [Aminobacter sp. AP02]PWK76027.1 hypothetical protein C8K44_10211 [Aminobacter sp. AP02]
MNSQSGLPADLSHFGNVEGYTHYPKSVTPGLPVPAGGGLLKWYDIAEAETPVTRETCALAQRFLAAETATGRLNLNGELGFVILHRCGGDFHFLLVSSWRNANEMWETVYAKTADAPDFSLFALPGPHRATFCVWELAAVNHERQAFSRYLYSARDDAAKREYLADMYEGGA